MERGYERVKTNESFWYTTVDGDVRRAKELNNSCSDEMYETANYYSNEKVAEDNARADRLFRCMRRFAAKNNKDVLNWHDSNESKYYIAYDYLDNRIAVDYNVISNTLGTVYFSSKEVAEQAIDKYRNELVWYFTEYHTNDIVSECEHCSREVKLQAMRTLELKECPFCGKSL